MLSGHNPHEEVQPCHSFILAKWLKSCGGQFHWQTEQRVLKFDIHIELTLFETLVSNQLEGFPSSFKQVVYDPQPSQDKFWHEQPTTPAMQSAIHQILHCPYQGLTRWLYLESKVIELIALRLDPVIQHLPADCVKIALQAKDRDRLHQARDILLHRLDNPPSVLELAKEVGLNHNKLKQGFRHVFGTTVFGYSQLCRLEKARQLLYEGHLTVAAVANEVGYANAAKFASVFKRKFGITPSACRLGKKLR